MSQGSGVFPELHDNRRKSIRTIVGPRKSSPPREVKARLKQLAAKLHVRQQGRGK